MTTSRRAAAPVYVWVWLPGEIEPVPAGVLERRGDILFYRYGRSYREREDSIPLYLPELPLESGWIRPLDGLSVAGVISDATPDAWGQRVVLRRIFGRGEVADTTELDIETYLLESGSDRAGALDFQRGPDIYVPRTSKASLEELMDAASRIETGQPVSPDLEAALLGGSSLGGARPKAALSGERRSLIVKFPSQNDVFPLVKAEAVAMDLAARVGLTVAPTELVQTTGRDVLLVERFDRVGDTGERRMVVSALTILGLPEHAARHATYHDLADTIRRRFTEPTSTLRELFGRIVFNICIGNTDDHARNHSSFWDGTDLTLTPAYDICAYPRVGGEASQAMAITRDNNSLSKLSICVEAAPIYGLTAGEAQELIDAQIDVITAEWKDAADRARLTEAERGMLWGRAVLNPFAKEGY